MYIVLVPEPAVISFQGKERSNQVCVFFKVYMLI